MQLPEAAQQSMSGIGQRDEAVAVAFGVADVDAPAHGVNVSHLQAQVWPISVQCRVLVVSIAGYHEHFIRLASAARARQSPTGDTSGRSPS